MKILDVNFFFKDTVPLWRPALELNGLPCVNKVLLYFTLLDPAHSFLSKVLAAGKPILAGVFTHSFQASIVQMLDSTSTGWITIQCRNKYEGMQLPYTLDSNLSTFRTTGTRPKC